MIVLCQRCNINPATHDICRETPLNVAHVCRGPRGPRGLKPEAKYEGKTGMITLGRYQFTHAFHWTFGVVEGPFDWIDKTTIYTDWHLGPVVIRKYRN